MPEQATYFVAPSGRDDGEGSRDDPFRTLGKALAHQAALRIVVAEGRYAEGPLSISRPVELIGPGGGGAAVEGKLEIAADRVRIQGVDLLGGTSARGVAELTLAEAHLAPGSEPAALAIMRSRGRLQDVTMDCGPEACALIATSTVGIQTARLTASGATKRGLRVESASVAASSVEVTGTSIAQLQVESGGFLKVSGATLQGAGGTGLVALRARLAADRVKVEGASRLAVLLARSDSVLTALEAGETTDLTVGVQAGKARIRDATLLASAQGTVSITGFAGEPPAEITFEGGVIRHGAQTAISLDQGRAIVRGTRFEGAPAAPGADGADAVTASGERSQLDIAGAVFERPAGFAVGLYNDAFGTVSATVTQPGIGGFQAGTTAGAPIVFRGGRIESCGSGSGIVALDALDVTVDAVEVRRCPEGGVLAGDGARVHVTGARLFDNAQYGLAAFGGAQLEATRTRVRGSTWAAFATCADGARVIDAGGNALEGPVTTCP